MWSVLTRVFSQVRYSLFAFFLFFLGLSIVVILPNLSLVVDVLQLDTISVWSKLTFIASLYGSLASNFTFFSAVVTVVLLVLFAINTSFLVFYLRRVQSATKGHKRLQAGSTLGVLSGVLGIGCAACGSVILTGLATSLGIAGVITFLPLRGGEFSIAGIVLLFFTIRYLAKKIADPLVCT